MKKRFLLLLVLIIAVAGGYGAYRYHIGTGKDTEKISSSDENAVYVDQIAQITGRNTGSGLPERFGGKVEPQEIWKVKLESERKVKKCLVKEGDKVKEGQVLFQYDTQEDEDKVAQAEIEIERSKGEIEVSNHAIAQLEKDRKASNADDQLSYTTNILTEQNSIKVNEYEIKTKELEIKQLQEKIADAEVKSEISGIVQEINDPNNTNDIDGSTYITIMADGDYRIKCKVNEQNLSLVYEGMQVLVHSRVNNKQSWKGVVSEIKTGDGEEDDSSDEGVISADSSGSSNYAFYVRMENTEGMILGQHVYLEEDKGADEAEEVQGIWLDEGYVVHEDEKTYVWKANQKNQLMKQEVQLGERNEDEMKYQILEGLSDEDYITYPMDHLEEGLPVIYNDNSADVEAEPLQEDPEIGENVLEEEE